MSAPMHPWNDPDNDGHDCIDCPNDSIWKCDRYAHPDGVLPPLTPIEGLETPDDLLDFVAPDDRKRLTRDLAQMARARRTAPFTNRPLGEVRRG